MDTVQDLINALTNLSDEQKKLPIFIYTPDENIVRIIDVDATITDRVDLNTEYDEEILA